MSLSSGRAEKEDLIDAFREEHRKILFWGQRKSSVYEKIIILTERK